jgi:VWFA-related protein
MHAKIAAAALLALLATPAIPQEKLVETIEVRVANVDVVVRDRQGHPVTGLTKDDFELYENGVKQTVTNLYEVRRDTATSAGNAAQQNDVPLEVRQRRLLIFVDCGSLQPANKRLLLASANRFIDRMLPEDQATLVAWRGGLHVVTPFTADKEKLEQGLRELERFGTAGESSADAIAHVKRDIQQLIRLIQTTRWMTWEAGYQESLIMVNNYSERLLKEQGRMIETVERLTANLAGLDGKKALLFVGEHFPQRPGAELYRYAFDQFEPHFTRNASNGINMDLQTLTGVMGNARPQEIEEMAKHVSANGVTIYAIDAGQIDSGVTSAADRDLQDNSDSFTRHANTAASFQTMAEITGGVALTQTANFDLAFDTISRDLDSYYSLGYKPKGEGSISTRKIMVKMKNRAYSVRSREALAVKSTDDQMSDKVIANLYADATTSAWPIEVRTGKPRQDGRSFVVPIDVVIPATMTLLPQDKDLVGSFTLYIVVGSNDGRTSEVVRSPHNLRLPSTGESVVRAKPMRFTTALRVSAGENVLSVAAIDQISGTTGFTRATIVAR